MSMLIPRNHTHLWNGLPAEERIRLKPHMIELHILHLEHTKHDIERNHNQLMDDVSFRIRNLKDDLAKFE